MEFAYVGLSFAGRGHETGQQHAWAPAMPAQETELPLDVPEVAADISCRTGDKARLPP
jgi:hypothetical protein